MRSKKIFWHVDAKVYDGGMTYYDMGYIKETMEDAIRWKWRALNEHVRANVESWYFAGQKGVIGSVKITPVMYRPEGEYWEQMPSVNAIDFISESERQTLEDANKTAIFRVNKAA